MWGVQAGDRNFSCGRVDHVVSVGQAAFLLLRAEVNEGFLRGLSRGDAIALTDQNGNSRDFELASLSRTTDGKTVLRMTVPEKAETVPRGVDKQRSITVHQRRHGQSLTTLLDQVASPRSFAPIRQGMASADIEAAIPVGGCVVTWSGESSALRSARGVAALAKGSGVVIGAARGMADETWRVVTYNPSDTGEMVLELPADVWWLSSGNDAPDEGFSLFSELSVDAQWELLERLLKSDNPTLEAGGGLSIPLLPMTVRHGERASFVSQIVTTFDLTRVTGRINTRFDLRIVPDPKHQLAITMTAACQPILVLGHVAGPGKHDRLVAIEPVTEGVAAEPTGLPVWQSGDGQPLEAVQPIPGYVREKQSALYSRWSKGDLVLVSLTEGNIPVLLGAPRKRMDIYETDNGPDVVLHGTRLRHIAESGDAANRTMLELGGDGRVAIAAPAQLDLANGMMVKPATVEIQRDVVVNGKVDVA
ncbi:hypothetical protein M2212_006228 [Bradyrhizobium elkanii]|uniref:hypothetical protein n=1 Tax=Bradyrhizobium elkanii TaxID=29448 RepID=UPI002166FE45|nr:hypothetical protein [Bradyrhizobium elkanii]MCS3479382.1 hypothetical protein [Bradyrhizobium elkanii]